MRPLASDTSVHWYLTLLAQAIVTDVQTIIDSGTTIVYGPAEQVEAFYSQIEDSSLFDEDNALYSYPCDASPMVAFNWGGADWSFSADSFNLGYAEDSSRCIGAISGKNLGLGENVWLAGDR